ncbi:TPA: WG repeat-containing protein, partial [Campylobacter coli]|nr:WG repeat-containing protein [Campylobacter coli]
MLDLLIKHKIKFTIAFLLLICAFAFYIYYSGENSKFYINNPNKQHSLESNNNHKILKEKCNKGDSKACFNIFASYNFTNEGLAIIGLNGKYSFMDTNGKMIINPKFDGVSFFRNGFAGIKLNNIWGFIDKNGKFVIEPKFDDVNDFNENLAGVKLNG